MIPTAWALLVCGSAWAGAWTRSSGAYYAKLGADLYVASDRVVPVGGPPSKQVFLGQQYTAYAEIGLLEVHPFQLGISAPLTVGSVSFERTDAFQTATGRVTSVRLGDLRVRPQVALHPRVPLSVGVEVKVPMYAVDGICADQGPYRDLCPRPGEGQIDVTEWLLAGATWRGLPLWGEAGVGYMHRTELFLGWDIDVELADTFVWVSNLGVNVSAWVLMAKAEGTHPLRADGITPGNARVGPAVLYTLVKGLGVEARAQWDVHARASPRGFGGGLGLSMRR